MNARPARQLPISTKLCYGSGDIGFAVIMSAVQFWLMPFYTDVALIAPALAGTALTLTKVWDAVNDPLFGWVADKTTSRRFGRRRVYLICGAIPFGLSIMLLWVMPPGLPAWGACAWILLTFIVYDTLFTVTSVPYYALTAELTDDYDERSGLTAFRMSMSVPAYILGAALTPALVGLFAGKRAGYAAVGISYGLIAAAGLLVCAFGIRENPAARAKPSSASPLRMYLDTFRNRPFVILIAAYTIVNTAFALVKTLLAYFLTYQLDMERQQFMVMGLMLVAVAVSLFPWKVLSEKWNKGPAYALGVFIGGCAVAATFLLPHKPTGWVYVIAVAAGFGFSVNWVFPWSMVPDVVEYDRLKTGETRSGIYFGVWGFMFKLSEVLGLAVTGWVLQLFGYRPNVEQSADTLLGIRLFVGPIPFVLFLIALPLLVWYPVTRRRHAVIRRRLARRSDA